MNGRVAKILRRHVGKAIADGKLKPQYRKRMLSGLKRAYYALDRHERDAWSILFTPESIKWKRLLRSGWVHIDFALKEDSAG